VVHQRFVTQRFISPGNVIAATEADTSLAVLFGAGAAVELGALFFVRPEIRLYGNVIPTLAILPCLGLGRRF
jgi:hypothetical protein